MFDVDFVLIAFRLQSEFGQKKQLNGINQRRASGLNRLSASVRIWTYLELPLNYKHDSKCLNRLSASVRIWTLFV